MAGPVLLAAGGTGGHLFPAEALAAVLAQRGITVHLATDERGLRYGDRFPGGALHEIPSATLAGKSPMALARTAMRLGMGLLASRKLIAALKPSVVIGFGGYPSVPPVLAAALSGVPTLIHEQNGVMGRANRLLSSRARGIATGFPVVQGLQPAWAPRHTVTGNPVRPAVLAAAETPFAPPHADAPLNLLVFGGSQGARVMSEVVPEAVALLSAPERARLRLVQQARDEDLAAVQARYGALGVEAEVAPFFRDLPARMAAAHLVISRSGASTVAELAVIGRPSLLVPLPHSLDGDQAANAAHLAAAGGATLVPQAEFTPASLAARLSALLADPARLTAAALAAKSVGIPDAADRLADLVVATAGHQTTKDTP